MLRMNCGLTTLLVAGAMRVPTTISSDRSVSDSAALQRETKRRDKRFARQLSAFAHAQLLYSELRERLMGKQKTPRNVGSKVLAAGAVQGDLDT